MNEIKKFGIRLDTAQWYIIYLEASYLQLHCLKLSSGYVRHWYNVNKVSATFENVMELWHVSQSQVCSNCADKLFSLLAVLLWLTVVSHSIHWIIVKWLRKRFSTWKIMLIQMNGMPMLALMHWNHYILYTSTDSVHHSTYAIVV